MARSNKLTAKKVASNLEPRRHSDGGGLYLSVSKAGTKRSKKGQAKDNRTSTLMPLDQYRKAVA